jgi:hypothetical protein
MKKKYRYQDENGEWVKGFYDEKEIEELKQYGFQPEEIIEYYNPNDEDKENPYYDISENEVADFMQAYPQAMLKSDYESQLKKKEQEDRSSEKSRREYERSKKNTTLQANINEISLNQQDITSLVVQYKQPGVGEQQRAEIKAKINALTQKNKQLLEEIKGYDPDAYQYGVLAQDQTIEYLDNNWDIGYTQDFWNGYEKNLNEKLDRAGKKAGIKTETIATNSKNRFEADRGLGELDKIHNQIVSLVSEVKQKSQSGMDPQTIKSIYDNKFEGLSLQAETFASKLGATLGKDDQWRIKNIVDSIRWYKDSILGGANSPGEIFTNKNFDFYIENSKQPDNWYNKSRKELGEKVGIVKGGTTQPSTPTGLDFSVTDINQYRLNSGNRFRSLTSEDLQGYSPEDQERVNAAMEAAGGIPGTPGYDANKALIAAGKEKRGVGANKVVKAAVDDYFDYYEKVNPEMAKMQKATYEAYLKNPNLNAYQQGQKLQFEQKAVEYANKALLFDLDRQKNNVEVLNEQFKGIDFQTFSSEMAIISKKEKEIKSQIDGIDKKMQPLVSDFETHKNSVEQEMERLNKLYEEGGVSREMYEALFNDLQQSLTQKQKELESKIKEITGGVNYQEEIDKLNKQKADLAIKTGVNEDIYKLSEQAAREYQTYDDLRSKLGNMEYIMQGWDDQYPDYKKELEQNRKIAEYRAKGSESELGQAIDNAPFWKQALYYGYKYLTPAGLLKETEIGRGFSQSVGSGILGITQLPEVFYRTFGGESYTWTTELYDWFQDVNFLRQGEFGDYTAYGYEQSTTDYLTYLGGNVVGSLALFASGGTLGGSTKVGQVASTFSTSYLTSLGDTYTDMLSIAKENDRSPQWAAAQSQAITVVLSAIESAIPDIKYFEPSAARKSIVQAIKSGKTVKESIQGFLEALPDSVKAYLKSSGKEGLEEWSAKLAEDVYKSSYNSISGVQYFNDTWDPSAHLESILGGVIGGVSGNFFSRPNGATTDIKLAMYESAENGQRIIDGAKNEKQRLKLQNDMKAPMESFSQLSSHANWDILHKEDRVEAFFLSQQINDLQKKVEENKKNGIEDKASENKLKEYQDGLNTILNSVTAEQAKGYNAHKQGVSFIVSNIGTEADFGVIEDSDVFQSLDEESQAAVTEIRQKMMEVAKDIDETGSEESTNTYTVLQSFVGNILNDPSSYKNGDYPWRIVEDTDNEIPMLEDKRSQYVSSRMHNLITEDVNRDQAQQIAREEWLKTDDGKRYLLLTQNKDDQKNRKGVPSEEQQGKESIQAEPVQGAGEAETTPGGVVQGAQEEVKFVRQRINAIESARREGKILEDEKPNELKELKAREKELKSQEAKQTTQKLTVGSKIQWDVFGNEAMNEWTVAEETTTRGGQPAVKLTRFIEQGVAEGGGVGGYTQEHIVPIADLQAKPKAQSEVDTQRQSEIDSQVELLNVEDVRRPNGAIGTQGFDPSQMKDLVKFMSETLGLGIPEELFDKSTDRLKPLIDYIKENEDVKNKIIEYVKQNPSEISRMPDGTIQFNDGNHRANLLNIIGSDVIPVIEQSKAKEINAKYESATQAETEAVDQASPEATTQTTEQVEEKTEEQSVDDLFNPSASFTSRVQFMSPEILMAKFGMSANQADAVMARMQEQGIVSEPDAKGQSEVLMKPYQVAPIIDERRARVKEEAQKQEQKKKLEEERANMTPEEVAYEENIDKIKGDIASIDPTLNDSSLDTAARLFANGLSANEAISKAKAEQKFQTRENRKKSAAANRVTLPQKGKPYGKPMNISDAVTRLGQALKTAGISTRVAESQDEFNKLAKEYGLDPNKTEGFFVSTGKNPQIIFNKKDLEGKYGKTILFHEGTHPIINIIRNTDPKLYKKLVDGLNKLAGKNKQVNKVREQIKKAVSEESFEDEFIVETIAQISSGVIDPSKLDKGVRSSLIKWMNKIAKMLGFGQIPINASTDEIINLAGKIKDVFEEGRDISEIVGEKNVNKYELKFVQPRAIELLMGKEDLSKYGLEPGKRYNVRQIYQAFEKRQRDLFGQIQRDDYSDKTMKQLAEWAKDEVMFMMTQFPNESGTGWYTTKFQAAIDEVAKIFPELATDKDQRSLFTMLVAIYSDGTKVEKNMSNAIMAYSDYKKTGVIPNTDTGGERNVSFNSNINEINSLIADFDGDLEAMTKYLLEEKSGSKLAQEAKENGEEFKTDWPAEMILPVASRVFGPKLGMFYSNLMGKEGYPTLDRWFSRLFNRYRGDLMPRLTGLKGKEKDTKGQFQGVARFKSLIGKPGISDAKAVETAKERALQYGSRTKLGDASKSSKMLSPIEKKVGMKQGPDKASKEKFKKAAKAAGIKLTSPEFKAHEQFVKDRTGGFWTELEGKVGFKQGNKTEQKERFDAAAAELGFGPDSKLYKNHLADKAANTIYKAAFVALNDAPFNRKDRKFMFDTLVQAREMLKKEGVDVTVADIQAILWYYEKKLYVSQGGLESAMGISYEEAAQKSVKEYIKNGGQLDTEVTEEDLIDEDGDIDPETGELVQPSRNIDRSSIDETNKSLEGVEKIPPSKVKGFSEGVSKVQEVAKEYKQQMLKGRTAKMQRANEPVFNLFSKVSKIISDAYDAIKNDPDNKEVKKAYEALVEETKQQYEFIISKGLNVVRHDGVGEPYPNSKEMLRDIRENNTLKFLPNDVAFGEGGTDISENIGLQPSGIKLADGYELTNSEVFRVVHDYFGHGILGNEFGAIGEENATLQHLDLYSDEAAPAVIFQTRGQNSWVNFSGVNDSANELRKQARELKKEGKIEEANKLFKEADKIFKFAEPKINIFPGKLNFKRYETARRINEQQEIDTRADKRSDVLSKLLEEYSKRSSGTRGVNKRDVQGVKRIGSFDLNVKAEYDLDKLIDSNIKKAFPDFKGVQKIYEITDGSAYRQMMIDSLKDNKFAASVTVHSAQDFDGMRMFVTEDGSTGITLTKEGFLGGAFSNPNAKRPQNLAQLMLIGIKEGATTAEAFDTILPDYYSNFGFKAVSRTAFNDNYRPLIANGNAVKDWDYETYKNFNNGRPDVVFFIYDGGDRNTIEDRLGLFDLYQNYEKSNTKDFNNNEYDKAEEVMKQQAVKRLEYELGIQEDTTTSVQPSGVIDRSTVEETTKALESNPQAVDKILNGYDTNTIYYRGTESAESYPKESVGQEHFTKGVSTAKSERYAKFHGNNVNKYYGKKGKFADYFDLVDQYQNEFGTEDFTEDELTNYGISKGYVGTILNDPLAGVDHRFFKSSFIVNADDLARSISQSYHKAKADGSNPELVNAVEDLLGKSTAQPSTGIDRSLPADLEIVNGFYSPIEKSLRETKAEKQSANKWLSGGIIGKGDEAVYTGVRQWLESKNPQEQVSKQEILDWMKNNRIEIKEVVKKGSYSPSEQEIDSFIERQSEFDDEEVTREIAREALMEQYRDQYSDQEATKFSQYQLEGEKSNYMEVLVTLPEKPYHSNDVSYIKVNGEWYGAESAKVKLGINNIRNLSTGETVNGYFIDGTKQITRETNDNFRSSHFEEPNILVHLRMNTRTDADGNKVLFLEEVQSDWGQKGKKEGFAEPYKPSDVKAVTEKENAAANQPNLFWYFEVPGNVLQIPKSKYATQEEARQYVLREKTTRTGGTPSAPFVTDTNAWTKLGLKFALQEAVRRGADKIAWTTGEQQNERYDLSKQVDEIRYQPLVNGQYDVSVIKDGSTLQKQVMKESELESNFGKDVANRMINMEGEFKGSMTQPIYSLKGDNLSVGGKGMIGFYGSVEQGKEGIVGGVAKALVKELTGKPTEIGETKISLSEKQENKKLGFAFVDNKWSAVDDNGKIVFSSDNRKDVLDFVKQGNLSTQSSIDVTPELVNSVKRGMPQASSNIDREQSDKQNAIDKQFLESNKITSLDVNRWLSDNNFESLLDPKAREKFNTDFKVTLPPLQEIMNVDQLDTAIQSGIDSMGSDLDQNVPFSQAFNMNIKSKPWYNLLTDNQKAELEEEARSIYAEEYAEESGNEIADNTPNDKANKLVELWYKKKDGQRDANDEMKRILASDEKLKYIWNNISPILRQLENKGILTKTAGCP